MATRLAAVAGHFYPGAAKTLRAEVDRCLNDCGVVAAPERVAAIVAPHAGYLYSGATAGHAFARVRGGKAGRVILIGRSHSYGFEGADVYTGDGFETPLGVAPVDTDFAGRLAKEIDAVDMGAHVTEHSLEVEVPFIQAALGDTPIVPILLGSEAGPWHIDLGERLAMMLDDSDLLVASTDLSHFLDEAAANEMDEATTGAILGQDCAAVCAGLRRDAFSMCGGSAVVVAMSYALARNALDWRLLDYRTSAAATGDRYRVVGYAAVTMERLE